MLNIDALLPNARKSKNKQRSKRRKEPKSRCGPWQPPRLKKAN